MLNQELKEAFDQFPREYTEQFLTGLKTIGAVGQIQQDVEHYLDERKGKEVLGGA